MVELRARLARLPGVFQALERDAFHEAQHPPDLSLPFDEASASGAPQQARRRHSTRRKVLGDRGDIMIDARVEHRVQTLDNQSLAAFDLHVEGLVDEALGHARHAVRDERVFREHLAYARLPLSLAVWPLGHVRPSMVERPVYAATEKRRDAWRTATGRPRR